MIDPGTIANSPLRQSLYGRGFAEEEVPFMELRGVELHEVKKLKQRNIFTSHFYKAETFSRRGEVCEFFR
jgi:hypothetical protein